MKYCFKCGQELNDSDKFCEKCGTKQDITARENSDKSTITFVSVLCYFNLLWLIGMLVPSLKDNPKIRFHVGQGIVLNIFSVALAVIDLLLTTIFNILIAVSPTIFGAIGVLTTLLSLAIAGVEIFFFVKGIINVCNDKLEPLPIIGKYSFYK